MLSLFFLGSVCLGPTLAWAETYRFRKGPYVQRLAATSLTVRWEGSEPRLATVVVTNPEGTARRVRTETAATFQGVEVRELTPTTEYTYVVEVEGVKSEAGHLRTAPADSDPRPFSFLVYGDNRTDHASHARVVNALRAAPSDFLVHTGDMVADGSNGGDWETFFQIETPLLRDRCVFSCVGNHELIGKGAAFYLRYFQPSGRTDPDLGNEALFSSMRWTNTRFFFLNSSAPWDNGQDRAWLERELGRAATEDGVAHRFVVLHHGLYSSGPHGPNANFSHFPIADLLRKSHVDLLFSGHDHLYERGEKNGLRYVVSGGGGAPLYKPRLTATGPAQAVESTHHFVEVQVDGATVALTARRTDGTTLETCRYEGESPWACESTIALRQRAVPASPPAAAPAAPSTSSGRRGCACTPPGSSPGSGSEPISPGLVGLGVLGRWLQRRRERANRCVLGYQTAVKARPKVTGRFPAGWVRMVFGLMGVMLLGCTTYESQFRSAVRYAESEQYDRSLALLRALEPDLDALRTTDRTHYFYYRGMIAYRLTSTEYPVRPDARYWLGLAKAAETQTPGTLRPVQKEQMIRALDDLVQDVFLPKAASKK